MNFFTQSEHHCFRQKKWHVQGLGGKRTDQGIKKNILIVEERMALWDTKLEVGNPSGI